MYQIAIAVRDTKLFLVATIVRSSYTDVYVNWPREHVRGWKPHASYHASGQHHQKSFGVKAIVKQREKPDTDFKGDANLARFGVSTDEYKIMNIVCEPNDFNEVFEIPDEILS